MEIGRIGCGKDDGEGKEEDEGRGGEGVKGEGERGPAFC